MNTIRRRHLLTGTALAGLAAVLPVAGRAAQPANTGMLDDPEFNLRAFARLASTLAEGETGFVRYQGKAFGVDGVDKNRMLYGIEGLAAIRTVPQADGSMRFLFNEAAVYLDPATGEPLQRWDNPYTGETVDVWHQRNGPINFAIAPGASTELGKFEDADAANKPGFRLPWEILGDVATYSQDLVSARPNPIDPEQHPAYSTGPVLNISEHSQYRVELQDLLDESIAALDFFAALQSLKPWHPWMRMGQRPGRVFTRMISTRADGIGALAPSTRAFAERELGDYLSAPTEWTGDYRDAYTLFGESLGNTTEKDHRGEKS